MGHIRKKHRRNRGPRADSHSLNIMASGILLMVTIATSATLSVFDAFIAPRAESIRGDNTSYMVNAANVVSNNVSVQNVLKAVLIDTKGTKAIDTFTSLRMTAMGEFVSGTVPVKARWYAKPEGGPDVELTSCAQKQQCEFATDAPGLVEINAVAQGKIGGVTIAVTEPRSRAFTDEVPAWADESVSSLRSLGIIRGYDDGRFGSADSLTRGQVLVLLTRVLAQTELAKPPRPCDQVSAFVPINHYAFDAYCLFDDRGWETGWSVAPDEPMSRGETAAYVNRVFGPAMLSALDISQGALLSGGPYFTDVPSDDWYFYDTAVANATGIMTGDPDGSFRMNDILNRAEGATVIRRLLDTITSLGIESL